MAGIVLGARFVLPVVQTPEDPAAPDAPSALAEADSHYARRDEGHRGALADPAEITRAVTLYERAAQISPRAEPRWKLARALYFQGAYTGLDERAQRAVFARALAAGEEAIERVSRLHTPPGGPGKGGGGPAEAAERMRGDADAAPSHFWAAVGWGQWALATGKLEAARKGAAQKIRDRCLALIALDPEFEEGGGYRVLGRLHDQAPRIPLLTGWISRDEGLKLLRLAAQTGPRNVVNRHFLAEALVRSGDRSEAIRLEEGVVSETPSAGHLVEELAIQEAARKNLVSWRGTSGG